MGFPDSSAGKGSTGNTGDPSLIPGSERSTREGQATHSSISGLPLWLSWWRIHPQYRRPGLGRSPEGGKGYLLQHSGLENSTDCIGHGVAKSQTWLSSFHSPQVRVLGLASQQGHQESAGRWTWTTLSTALCRAPAEKVWADTGAQKLIWAKEKCDHPG